MRPLDFFSLAASLSQEDDAIPVFPHSSLPIFHSREQEKGNGLGSGVHFRICTHRSCSLPFGRMAMLSCKEDHERHSLLWMAMYPDENSGVLSQTERKGGSDVVQGSPTSGI